MNFSEPVAQSRTPPVADSKSVSVSSVARRERIAQREFEREFRNKRRPLILGRAAEQWPLYGRATPDYFRQHHGARMVSCAGTPMRLDELILKLESSSSDNPGPYPCKYEIAKDFPDLIADLTPRFEQSLPDRQANALLPSRLLGGVNNLEIFFGGPGGEFPYLHYDVLRLHAWITQLHGDKEFTLYAPDQEHLLYVNPEIPWQSSIINHHNPDYDRYPLFREAVGEKVVVSAGETLFLPCGWWHTARSLNMTISIAFDQLGPDNWGDFIGDVVGERVRIGKATKARLIGAWLRAVGPLMTFSEWFGANRSSRWGAR